ncbi:hypothetical protein BCL57_001017 [Agromyces flavus]|uniref:Uncharacterized protein n=1 Tax=Agromyces flavus TaxID=589382 RepID=A0A1H1YZD4_9MICO|nr:hypothetical protein [Agromyces flavus]MCP2366863.1 hypothetical protein [Agromyces flavus]GGI46870.1 hypothetical protein GCM10010932_16800 [Agromyces flavus]SDT26780.1 hypothetical protein SAMN04489721_2941 [Agromyces flavus]
MPLVEPGYDPVLIGRRRRLIQLESAIADLRELRREVEASRPGLVPQGGATWHSRAAAAYAERRESIRHALANAERLLGDAEAALAAEAERVRRTLDDPSPDDVSWLIGDRGAVRWAT